MAGTVTTEWKMPKTASLLVRKVAYLEDLDCRASQAGGGHKGCAQEVSGCEVRHE